MENGKATEWKVLAGVWDLLDNPAEFSKYVQNEIRKYLYGAIADQS